MARDLLSDKAMKVTGSGKTDYVAPTSPNATTTVSDPKLECTKEEAHTEEYKAQAQTLVKPNTKGSVENLTAPPDLLNDFSATLAAQRLLGPKGASMRAIPEEHGGEGHEGGHNPGAVTGEASRTVRHLTHGATELNAAVREGKTVANAAIAIEEGVEAATKHAHGAGPMMKGLGVLGGAGGAVQAVDGAIDIAHGEVGKGTTNLVAGTAYTGAALAELGVGAPLVTAATGLTGEAATAALGPVALGLVGGGAVVEGGRQIYEGVTTDNTQATTVGGVKVAGGALIAGSLAADGSVIGIPLGIGMAVVGAAMVGGAAIYENVAGHGEEH